MLLQLQLFAVQRQSIRAFMKRRRSRTVLQCFVEWQRLFLSALDRASKITAHIQRSSVMGTRRRGGFGCVLRLCLLAANNCDLWTVDLLVCGERRWGGGLWFLVDVASGLVTVQPDCVVGIDGVLCRLHGREVAVLNAWHIIASLQSSLRVRGQMIEVRQDKLTRRLMVRRWHRALVLKGIEWRIR